MATTPITPCHPQIFPPHPHLQYPPHQQWQLPQLHMSSTHPHFRDTDTGLETENYFQTTPLHSFFGESSAKALKSIYFFHSL